MAKLKALITKLTAGRRKITARVTDEGVNVIFYCFACKSLHAVPKRDYGYNGNSDSPSFNGMSIYGAGSRRRKEGKCHFYMVNGALFYLYDCDHGYSGKSVEMPTVDRWYQDLKLRSVDDGVMRRAIALRGNAP